MIGWWSRTNWLDFSWTFVKKPKISILRWIVIDNENWGMEFERWINIRGLSTQGIQVHWILCVIVYFSPNVWKKVLVTLKMPQNNYLHSYYNFNFYVFLQGKGSLIWIGSKSLESSDWVCVWVSKNIKEKKI